MATELRNQIEIRRDPRAVYDYVTQPWRWHEWHPSSLGATAEVEVLRFGDHFDERIVLQPLAPLPLKLHRATRYVVLQAEPGVEWQARGEMQGGWLRIHYRFSPTAAGTRFERTLEYAASGFQRLLLPLLRPRTARLSEIALENLRKRLERDG